jgi:hypothetical protein
MKLKTTLAEKEEQLAIAVQNINYMMATLDQMEMKSSKPANKNVCEQQVQTEFT